MNTHRAVSVLLAVVAATMLVTGSFGFTSVSAERGVSVNVVESEEAYVGVTTCKESNGKGNGVKAEINVSNQFSDSFTVEEITVGESGESTWVKGPIGDPIPPGEWDTFRVKADDNDKITIDVTDGLDASVSVEVSEEKCLNNGQGVNRNQSGGQNTNGTATPTPEST